MIMLDQLISVHDIVNVIKMVYLIEIGNKYRVGNI